MSRTRIKLAVYVDLDDFPGVFHTAESAQHAVRNILNDWIPYYKPSVSIESYDTSEQYGERDDYTVIQGAPEVLRKYLVVACPKCEKPEGDFCDTSSLWVHLERFRLVESRSL